MGSCSAVIVLTDSDTSSIFSLKSSLQSRFHTKDLGVIKYILDIEVMTSKKGIFMSQRKYMLDLLSETEKLGVKPCSTPIKISNPSYIYKKRGN